MLPVSLIIPTQNRAAVLRRALQSIAAVVPPTDPVEIIVIDNGSTDRTPEVCGEIRAMFPEHAWRYFHEPMPGLLSGRHRGAKEARGEILSYLDDDVLLSPSWLEGVTEAFGNPDVALVGGPSVPEFQDKPPQWLDNLWDEHEDKGRRTLFALSLIDSGPAVRPGRSAPCHWAQSLYPEGCLRPLWWLSSGLRSARASTVPG